MQRTQSCYDVQEQEFTNYDYQQICVYILGYTAGKRHSVVFMVLGIH